MGAPPGSAHDVSLSKSRFASRFARLSRLALQPDFAALAPDIARGLRGGVATLFPYYLAARLGRREFAWMALGGWLGTLADPSGSRVTRARTLFAFAIVGAGAIALSEWSAGSLAGAALCLAAIAFGAALLRALGAAASSFGTLIAVIAAIATAHYSRTSLRDGLYFAAGAGLALVLTSIVWPVWMHLPLRRAIARVWRAMGDYAAALANAIDQGYPEGDARWTEIQRLQHRRFREAVEAARAATLAERARRSGESRVGGNLRVLLGLAESQWPLLVTLSQEVEAASSGRGATATRDSLTEVAETYGAIERILITPVLQSSSALESEPRESTAPVSAAPLATVLVPRLTRASLAALARARALAAPVDAQNETAQPRPTFLRETLATLATSLRALRDAFTPRSTFFRHGLRVGGAAIAASIVGARLSAHPQWVTVTTIAVLQPYAGATVSRAAQRVIGTLLGSLVAIAITMTIHARFALAAVMFPLSVAAVATQPRSYRLFTFFLTPVFVLLSERYPGDWWTAAARAGDAVAGGAIALVAAVLVFPSRETTRLSDTAVKMLRAVADYAEVVLADAGVRPTPDALAREADARRTAGIALGEAEALLERLLAEPMPAGRAERVAESEKALLLITYARRTTSAITAFATVAATALPAGAGAREAAETAAAYVTGVFAKVEELVREGKRGEPAAVPELGDGVNERVRVGLERVMRYAALVGGVARG